MKKIIVVIALLGAAYSANAQRTIQLLDTVGVTPTETVILGSPTGGTHAFTGGGDSILTVTGTNVAGRLVVANGSLYNSVALSGDAALTSAGALTISKINGVPLDATVTAPTVSSILVYNLSTLKWEAHALGTAVALNYSTGAVSLNSGVVSYSNIQAMTTNKLLGSGSGTAVAEITLGTGLSFTGTTLNATAGSSYGTVSAGATITIPDGNTVVTITDNSTSGQNNNITMPTGTNGQILYIYNADAEDTGVTSGPVITAGQTATFVYAASGWRRVAP